jgi:hypothetical protein
MIQSLLYDAINKVFEIDPQVAELGLLLLPEPSNLQSITSIDSLLNTEILPSLSLEKKHETSAVILKDHKLAIAFWSIPLFYSHAYQLFLSSSQDENVLLQSTRAMLLINADCYTAWNRRKRVILSRVNSNEFDDLVKAELNLLNLIGTKHPKSGEMWHHRFWVIKNCILKFAKTMDSQFVLQLLNTEMQFSERMAAIYPRNYYSWTNRNLLLKELEKQGLDHLIVPLVSVTTLLFSY